MKLSQAESIKTLDDLRGHLQYALGIELTTIPAYLCALYSIEEGENTAAVETIQSVVLEEMLHMALAANVLNAIGGIPSTAAIPGVGTSPIPVYPTKVPFIDKIPEIHLAPFSPQALDTFIAIELPAESDGAGGDKYDSIGAFYGAIERGLEQLCPPEVFADAAKTRAGCQLSPRHYYGGAGRLIKVTDLSSALTAIEEIVREGEGAPAEILGQTIQEHVRTDATAAELTGLPYSVDDLDRLPFGWKMYSHYARFKEIRAGRRYLPTQLVDEQPLGDVLPVDWSAVQPMAPDPRAEAFVGTPAYEPMVACNQTYTSLVDTIYGSFNGDARLLETAVHLMYELKYQAVELMRVPSPLEPGVNLGPAFEYRRSGAPT